MASPIAGAITWTRQHAGLATAVGAGGLVVVFAARRAAAPSAMPASDTSQGALASGAAGTDAQQTAALIAQGAGLALQGAGLGLPLVQGGLDLAGAAVGALGGAVSTLAGSQADTAATIGGVLAIQAVPGTVTGCGPLPLHVQPPGTQRVCLNGTWQDIPIPVPVAPAPGPAPPQPAPVPTPTPAPAAGPMPSIVGYEVQIANAGTVIGYIVSSTCGLSPRAASFRAPSHATVVRGTCNGRVYWRTVSGGLSGMSYVAGLSTGPWYITQVLSDGTRVRIASTGS